MKPCEPLTVEHFPEPEEWKALCVLLLWKLAGTKPLVITRQEVDELIGSMNDPEIRIIDCDDELEFQLR